MHTFIFVYVHTCKHISWNSDFLLCCLSDCLIFKFCVSECHGKRYLLPMLSTKLIFRGKNRNCVFFI